MRRLSLLPALVPALLLLGLAAGARMPEQADALGPLSGGGLHARAAIDWLRSHASVQQGEEEKQAIITARYMVPPSVNDSFVEEWKKVFEQAQKAQGVMVFDMGKTEIDNVLFMSYEEWKSWGDFKTHMDSDYMKAWIDFLADNKVMLTWHSLAAPAKDVKPTGSKGDEEGEGWHMIVRYMVSPDMHEDFISTWQEVADTVKDKEQGHNLVYSLRKVETDNYQFYIYGSWQSYEDWQSHFKSEHVKKLLDFNKKNDIAWFMAPLKKFGQEQPAPAPGL